MRVYVDKKSLLADADGAMSLGQIEEALAADGLTLGVEPSAWDGVASMPVARWLAEGAPGARDPWLDPADHLLAGFEAEVAHGRTLRVRTAPRRAVGPDLAALVVGMRERFAKLRRATVRVHTKSAVRPSTAAFEAERDPKVSAEEEELLRRIEAELG